MIQVTSVIFANEEQLRINNGIKVDLQTRVQDCHLRLKRAQILIEMMRDIEQGWAQQSTHLKRHF